MGAFFSMKTVQLTLPNYLAVYFEQEKLRAYKVETDKGFHYLVSHRSFVISAQSKPQLLAKARRLFMQFFCEYMHHRHHLNLTIVEKIELFLTEMNLQEDKELQNESFVKSWQRYRVRQEQQKNKSLQRKCPTLF